MLKRLLVVMMVISLVSLGLLVPTLVKAAPIPPSGTPPTLLPLDLPSIPSDYDTYFDGTGLMLNPKGQVSGNVVFIFHDERSAPTSTHADEVAILSDAILTTWNSTSTSVCGQDFRLDLSAVTFTESDPSAGVPDNTVAMEVTLVDNTSESSGLNQTEFELYHSIGASYDVGTGHLYGYWTSFAYAPAHDDVDTFMGGLMMARHHFGHALGMNDETDFSNGGIMGLDPNHTDLTAVPQYLAFLATEVLECQFTVSIKFESFIYYNQYCEGGHTFQGDMSAVYEWGHTQAWAGLLSDMGRFVYFTPAYFGEDGLSMIFDNDGKLSLGSLTSTSYGQESLSAVYWMGGIASGSNANPRQLILTDSGEATVRFDEFYLTSAITYDVLETSCIDPIYQNTWEARQESFATDSHLNGELHEFLLGSDSIAYAAYYSATSFLYVDETGEPEICTNSSEPQCVAINYPQIGLEGALLYDWTFRIGTTGERAGAGGDEEETCESPYVYYEDSDGDGYGEHTASIDSCDSEPPSGFVTDSTDCDDNTATTNPGALESCDEIDNDCDHEIDEGLETEISCPDYDHDGTGTPNELTESCKAPDGYVTTCTDCNDADGEMAPGKSEICDSKDNNCNGETDEGLTQSYCYDADNDGHGDPNDRVESCVELGAGYTVNCSDCNDAASDIYPGALDDECDGEDNNCNGDIDEGVTTIYCDDADRDGYGNPNIQYEGCNPPDWFVQDCSDCNDAEIDDYPGAEEICDERDNNCNGEIDEGVSQTFCQDRDGDGHGDPATSVQTCSAEEAGDDCEGDCHAYVSLCDDCDDNAMSVHPGMEETCQTLWDDNCNGQTDDLPDCICKGTAESEQTACINATTSAYPSKPEVCQNLSTVTQELYICCSSSELTAPVCDDEGTITQTQCTQMVSLIITGMKKECSFSRP